MVLPLQKAVFIPVYLRVSKENTCLSPRLRKPDEDGRGLLVITDDPGEDKASTAFGLETHIVSLDT